MLLSSTNGRSCWFRFNSLCRRSNFQKEVLMNIINIIPDFFKGSDDMLDLIGSFEDVHLFGLKADTDGLHVHDNVTDCVECRNEWKLRCCQQQSTAIAYTWLSGLSLRAP